MIRRNIALPLTLPHCSKKRRNIPGFDEFGLACFRDLVYDVLKHKAKDVVIDEREREQVDRALLANVLDIFVVMGKGERSMDSYRFCGTHASGYQFLLFS